MSGMLTEAVSRLPDLTPHERTVLLVLADHAKNDSKRCWPGIKRIAVRCNMSDRHVSRILKVLKKRCLISILGKHGNVGTNVYLLHLHLATDNQSGAKVGMTQDHPQSAIQSDTPCPTVTLSLTEGQTNKGSEQGNEKGKDNKKTNGEPKTLLKSTLQENPQEEEFGKLGEQEAEQALPGETAPPPVPLAPLPEGKDSKLVALWKAEVTKLGQTALVPPVEAKMLRSFANLAGYENASSVIPVVVEAWLGFTLYCEKTAGAFNSPKEPDIRYLNKHQSKAIDFYKQKCEEAINPDGWNKVLDCLKHLSPKDGAKSSLAKPNAGKILW